MGHHHRAGLGLVDALECRLFESDVPAAKHEQQRPAKAPQNNEGDAAPPPPPREVVTLLLKALPPSVCAAGTHAARIAWASVPRPEALPHGATLAYAVDVAGQASRLATDTLVLEGRAEGVR